MFHQLLGVTDKQLSRGGRVAGKTKKRGAVGRRVVSSISHPVRIEAQRILFYRVASPNEIAQELGVTISTASYHVKQLLAEGCIELVKEVPRRGAVEHYYRAKIPTAFFGDEWTELPRETRSEISGLVLQAIFGEVMRALDADTFDARLDRHLSWIPIELDEQAWRELSERQLEWLQEIETIKASARERLEAAGEDGQRVVTTMMTFETPSGFGFRDA